MNIKNNARKITATFHNDKIINLVKQNTEWENCQTLVQKQDLNLKHKFNSQDAPTFDQYKFKLHCGLPAMAPSWSNVKPSRVKLRARILLFHAHSLDPIWHEFWWLDQGTIQEARHSVCGHFQGIVSADTFLGESVRGHFFQGKVSANTFCWGKCRRHFFQGKVSAGTFPL